MADTVFLDWDDDITADGGDFTPLQPGIYTATVTKITKDKWTYPGKMNGCKVARIDLRITSPQGVKAVNDLIFLSSDVEWRIGQYLHAFGLKAKGEPSKPSKIMQTLNKSCQVKLLVETKDHAEVDPEDFEKAVASGVELYNKVREYKPLENTPRTSNTNGSGFNPSEFGF